MHFIDLPDGPGVEGVRAAVHQIKRLQDPDPWAGETPITIRCQGSALSLAKLLRWDKIPGVTLQAA